MRLKYRNLRVVTTLESKLQQNVVRVCACACVCRDLSNYTCMYVCVFVSGGFHVLKPGANIAWSEVSRREVSGKPTATLQLHTPRQQEPPNSRTSEILGGLTGDGGFQLSAGSAWIPEMFPPCLELCIFSFTSRPCHFVAHPLCYHYC